MIYIVSGFMRSGTSMMMKCLEAGGMNAAYSHDRDRYLNERFGDSTYLPNGLGFYELEHEQYSQPGFPDSRFEGKLIKILFGGMFTLKSGSYKVVFMRRDFDSIRKSYQAFFGVRRQFEKAEYQCDIAQGILDVRNDVDLTVVEYDDVISNPTRVFSQIRSDGWPISCDACTSVVDESLNRFGAT